MWIEPARSIVASPSRADRTRLHDFRESRKLIPTRALPGCHPSIMERMSNGQRKIVYWHRELPPFNAEPMGEHVVEATSRHVPDTVAHRDEIWNHCQDELMANACERLQEEIDRLGGRYAHVLDESTMPCSVHQAPTSRRRTLPDREAPHVASIWFQDIQRRSGVSRSV